MAEQTEPTTFLDAARTARWQLEFVNFNANRTTQSNAPVVFADRGFHATVRTLVPGTLVLNNAAVQQACLLETRRQQLIGSLEHQLNITAGLDTESVFIARKDAEMLALIIKEWYTC